MDDTSSEAVIANDQLAAVRALDRQMEAAYREGAARIQDPSRLTQDPFLEASTLGLGFYLLLAFVLALELIEIILGFVELVGWATIAIGIAVHIVVMLLSTVAGIAELTYFYSGSVPRSDPRLNSSLRIVLSMITKYVPVIGDFLPVETLVLFTTGRKVNKLIKSAQELREQENAEIEQELAVFAQQITTEYEANLRQITGQ